MKEKKRAKSIMVIETIGYGNNVYDLSISFLKYKEEFWIGEKGGTLDWW